MEDTHRRKLEKLDGDSIKVQFSPRVRSALADLDAAVRFSEHFDRDGYAILHDWATGKSPTVREVMVSLPLLAEDMFEHIRASDGKRAEDAWRQLCSDIFEHGFTLSQRTRQP